MTEASDKLITVAAARELLGISRTRMSELIANGSLKWQPSPLDRRVKLVKFADIQELARRAGREIDEGKSEAAA
jgi:hypothetical protein